MNKRDFLNATALTGLAISQTSFAKASAKIDGPRLLIVTGVIGKTNRGGIDPVLDQMMLKQKLKFDKAFGFDFQMLTHLPQAHFTTTLEYDNKPHQLSGPLLLDVLQVVGVKWQGNRKILLRAIDGFAVVVTMSEIKKQAYIVATHLDKVPMSLGGLGPLWAVLNADVIPELATKPVNERFGLCPWGLYHIEVLE